MQEVPEPCLTPCQGVTVPCLFDPLLRARDASWELYGYLTPHFVFFKAGGRASESHLLVRPSEDVRDVAFVGGGWKQGMSRGLLRKVCSASGSWAVCLESVARVMLGLGIGVSSSSRVGSAVGARVGDVETFQAKGGGEGGRTAVAVPVRELRGTARSFCLGLLTGELQSRTLTWRCLQLMEVYRPCDLFERLKQPITIYELAVECTVGPVT